MMLSATLFFCYDKIRFQGYFRSGCRRQRSTYTLAIQHRKAVCVRKTEIFLVPVAIYLPEYSKSQCSCPHLATVRFQWRFRFQIMSPRIIYDTLNLTWARGAEYATRKQGQHGRNINCEESYRTGNVVMAVARNIK